MISPHTLNINIEVFFSAGTGNWPLKLKMGCLPIVLTGKQ